MTKVCSYTLEKGQIVEVRVVAKEQVVFQVDNVPVLKSDKFDQLDANNGNVCLAIFNFKSDAYLKLLSIKTTCSKVYKNKIIPDLPLLLNSHGEELQRCSLFPEIYGELGYI